MKAALAGVVTPVNHLIGDGRKASRPSPAKPGFHSMPRQPAPEAPHLHINNVNAYHSRLKQ